MYATGFCNVDNWLPYGNAYIIHGEAHAKISIARLTWVSDEVTIKTYRILMQVSILNWSIIGSFFLLSLFIGIKTSKQAGKNAKE